MGWYEERQSSIERADDRADDWTEAAMAAAEADDDGDTGRWALVALLPASADPEELHARAYALGMAYAAILWPREPSAGEIEDLAARVAHEQLLPLAGADAAAFSEGGERGWRTLVRRAIWRGFWGLYAEREGTKVLAIADSGPEAAR